MHYSVGQSVYGGHTIITYTFEEADNSYNIYIKKNRRSIAMEEI